MKFRMIIRINMMAMMVGAALMLASSVYAQQEMDPTTFPDGQNVVPFEQPVAVDANSTYTMDSTNTSDLLPAVAVNDENTVQETSVAQWTPEDVWSMTTLLISMLLLVLYGALAGKRERRELSSSPRVLTPSDLTAH